jgi:hypothetical protein
MIGRLPMSLEVGGEECSIRTDFRDILVIMEACADPDLSDREKTEIMLTILYENFENMPSSLYPEAAERATWFIDCGNEQDDGKRPKKLMDWSQDEKILFPAINKVAGREVRTADYIHWWTFMGYFMEIEEGTFSTVLTIRQKKSSHKQLSKWEQDFYRKNKSLCDLKTRYTKEEQAEIDYWNQLLGG